MASSIMRLILIVSSVAVTMSFSRQSLMNSIRRMEKCSSLRTSFLSTIHHQPMNTQHPRFISPPVRGSSSLAAPFKSRFHPTRRCATMLFSSSTSSSNEDTTYILRFDGQVDKVTNDAGIGIIIYDASNGSKLWSGYCFIPKKAENEMTKNVADYMALNDGLRVIQFLSSSYRTTLPRIEIQTSNDIISKHLNGKYRVSSKILLPWYEKVCELTKGGDNVATVKVDKVETKLAKQNAMYAIKGRDSDNNYKSTMRDISTTSPPSSGGNDFSFPSFDITSSNDNVSTTEAQKEVETIAANTSWESSNGQAELSNSQSLSADKTYILRFDGGSRGNPGIAGSGMVLYDSDDGSEVWSGYQYLGDNFTNNEAEYVGLITGLQCARSLGVERIVAQGDSKLILQQVEGKWKVKAAHLRQYYDEAISMKKEFASFETCHIERARNARADELANTAMDTKQSRGFEIQ